LTFCHRLWLNDRHVERGLHATAMLSPGNPGRERTGGPFGIKGGADVPPRA
jgi:hypothetical protein